MSFLKAIRGNNLQVMPRIRRKKVRLLNFTVNHSWLSAGKFENKFDLSFLSYNRIQPATINLDKRRHVYDKIIHDQRKKSVEEVEAKL